MPIMLPLVLLTINAALILIIVPVSQKPNNNHTSSNDDGGKLFVESAQALLNLVQAGVVVNNTGNVKDGIPYIVAGLNGLATLMAHTRQQQRAYQRIIDYMLSRSDAELTQLLTTARNRASARTLLF